MNGVDILLLLIVALSIWNGWRKGFLLGTTGLLIWMGSLLAAFFFYKYVAQWIESLTVIFGLWTAPLSFLLTALVARGILSSIANLFLKKTTAETHAHGVNRFLGLLPGAANGLINAVIASALLLSLPLFEGLSQQAQDSRLAASFTPTAEWLEDELSPVFNPAVQQTLNRLTVKPGSDELVTLPYKVTKVRPRPDLEAEMLQLVNEERRKAGLNPVAADPEMIAVARAHSTDMFARGYFAHNNLDGKTPFDRMRSAGVKFRNAGENLALAQTLFIAHKGLMNSPGHRANILEPSFGRLGIGIMDGGLYGLMISQEFRN